MEVKELVRRLLQEHKQRCEFCNGSKEGECPFFVNFKNINWGYYNQIGVYKT